MINDFECCRLCFNEIQNTRAQLLWMNLCHLSVYRGPTNEFFMDELSEINYLENLGFILTTETEASVIIRIIGFDMDGKGDVFVCPRGCANE